MAWLELVGRRIAALAAAVIGVRDVTGGATLAAVVAVHADSAAHRAARAPEVAVHARLARQVGVVVLDAVARPA